MPRRWRTERACIFLRSVVSWRVPPFEKGVGEKAVGLDGAVNGPTKLLSERAAVQPSTSSPARRRGRPPPEMPRPTSAVRWERGSRGARRQGRLDVEGMQAAGEPLELLGDPPRGISRGCLLLARRRPICPARTAALYSSFRERTWCPRVLSRSAPRARGLLPVPPTSERRPRAVPARAARRGLSRTSSRAAAWGCRGRRRQST